MRRDEYYKWAEWTARWGQEYLDEMQTRPVRSGLAPGQIAAQIPQSPPEEGAEMTVVLEDFCRIVPPGMTHWQHPGFMAYFAANAAPASMIAENLVNVMAAQCMLWQTSPAATELETRMVDWLRQAVGLPRGFRGVIQDSATSANLSAVLTMRERALSWRGLEDGLSGAPALRVYSSPQAHSSVDKAVRLAGIGQRNLIKVDTDEDLAMDPEALRMAIAEDESAGRLPVGVVLCVGGTSLGASDRLRELIAVAKDHDLYVHVDAAWAGTAMICPELRGLWDGIELADSIVFNPHKWLGAQFDCSVQFLADPTAQVKVMSVQPEYLRTLELESEDVSAVDHAVNYSEWTIPLGRRFRALKLWFVLRAHGLEDLRGRIRNHIAWANEAASAIAELPAFRIVTRPRLALFSFRWEPELAGCSAPRRAVKLEQLNAELLAAVNEDGRVYLTQTRHEGQFVIRLQVGQFDCEREHVMTAVEVLRELTENWADAG